jgi:hypothetical protein
MAERLDLELGEAVERPERLARGEDHYDPLGQEAARHEGEYSSRRVVQPLRVVHKTEQGLLLGGLRQQVEDGEPDEERIRSPSGTQAERDLQGLALVLGQVLLEIEARRTELLKCREREFHFPLDADRAGDPEVCPRPDRRLEQCGLADARLAVDRQYAAVAVARGLQHAVEHRVLALSAEQLPRLRPHDHLGSMPPSPPTKDFLDSIAWPRRQQCLPQTRKESG